MYGKIGRFTLEFGLGRSNNPVENQRRLGKAIVADTLNESRLSHYPNGQTEAQIREGAEMMDNMPELLGLGTDAA